VTDRTTIDLLLAQARIHLDRVTPAQALAAQRAGGIIVDTRSPDERRRQGAAIPGALELPLSVVLWALDPDEPAGEAPVALDALVMLICREGYSSSPTAAQLQELGFANATDVIGGVDAWLAAGLPVEQSESTLS
jgi:rhodanese-related sulfurtransferase